MNRAAWPRRRACAARLPYALALGLLLVVRIASAQSSADAEPVGPETCAEVPPGAEAPCAGALGDALRAVGFAWAWPHARLEGEWSRAFGYAAYPYRGDEPGLLRFGPPVDGLRNPRSARAPGRRAAAELELGAGVLAGWSARTNVAVRVRTPWRLSPGVELFGYREREAGATQRALLGMYSMRYRFAQSESLALRTGVGGLSYTDRHGTRGGGYASYGVEWFAGRPFLLDAEVSIGGLGSAFYSRLYVAAGVLLWRVELRLAYDHVGLRGAQGVERLSGPQVSLRVWL